MPVIADRSRPLQNRVTPWGDIVANPARGLLMGNRGRLHDDGGRIVRTAANLAWISCVTSWNGISRTLMNPTSYTELFFTDEATALAAGHRPCGQCRREAYDAFKAAWATAHGLATMPGAPAIDAVIAAERAAPKPLVEVRGLPDGAMVTVPGSSDAWAIRGGRWYRWSFGGYGDGEVPRGTEAQLLTPPSIVKALRAGYRPEGMRPGKC